jgi:hypothetical protein
MTLNSYDPLALLLYDVICTLDDEIQYFWKRQWTIPTFLYFGARYLTLLFFAIRFGIGIHSGITPNTINISVLLVIILQIWVGLCMFYRVWAINRATNPHARVLTVTLAVIAISFISFLFVSAIYLRTLGLTYPKLMT